MQITVRQVEEKDYPQIARIYAHPEVMEQTTQLPYRDAAFWKSFYSSKSPDGLELAALCDGQIAGHLGILLNRDARRKHTGSFGLAVHRDFQGKGVGKALMNELISLADNWLNLVKIELDVFSDNRIAIALYQKFGFEIEGELKYNVFKRGEYCHTTRMGRIQPGFFRSG